MSAPRQHHLIDSWHPVCEKSTQSEEMQKDWRIGPLEYDSITRNDTCLWPHWIETLVECISLESHQPTDFSVSISHFLCWFTVRRFAKVGLQERVLIQNSSEDFYLERIWIRVYESQSNNSWLTISGIGNAMMCHATKWMHLMENEWHALFTYQEVMVLMYGNQ